MNKIALVTLGIIAGIIALANLGSLLGLAFSAFIAYVGFHYYQKSDSTIIKLFWGGVLLIGLLTAIANIPAFLGILAILALLYVWNKWNTSSTNDIIEHKPSDDPFVNFEKQWDELTK